MLLHNFRKFQVMKVMVLSSFGIACGAICWANAVVFDLFVYLEC